MAKRYKTRTAIADGAPTIVIKRSNTTIGITTSDKRPTRPDAQQLFLSVSETATTLLGKRKMKSIAKIIKAKPETTIEVTDF